MRVRMCWSIAQVGTAKKRFPAVRRVPRHGGWVALLQEGSLGSGRATYGGAQAPFALS